MRIAILVVVALAGAAAPARAERVEVFSVRGADCGDCGKEIIAELKRLKGVKKPSFDILKVELTVTLADGVPNDSVLAAIRRAGLEGSVGPGQGAYLPHAPYPEGADVAYLTRDGSAVGPLERLRVPGRYTVFDVYADWCGPCRAVDARLRELAGARSDIAVRKLDLVHFKSALARELGARVRALPFVVVFSPDGRRTDITGADLKRLAAALGER